MTALKKIWNWFTTLLVIAVVLLAIALVGVRVVGLEPYTVLSGSMEPTYHTGSLIYVKKIDYRELKVGDPITFMLSENTVATHRIVEIIPDEEDPSVLRFITKGDNNQNVDGGRVHYKNVIGKPVFTIPKLGYVASYVQNPPGTYIALSAGAFAILLMFLPELFRAIFTDEESEKKKKEAEPPPEEAPKNPSRGAGDKKCSADNEHMAVPADAKAKKEPPRERRERPAPVSAEETDKKCFADNVNITTPVDAKPEKELPFEGWEEPAPLGAELPETEERPLTRAELRRQTEAAAKAAKRERAQEKPKAIGLLPKKKKGRHEL